MRKVFIGCLAFFFFFIPLAAAEPKENIVKEMWDAAYLDGAKAGHVLTVVREIEQDGRKLFRTTVELNLTVKRFKDTVNLRMETGSVEDKDGKVTAVFMKQLLGKEQELVSNGTVEGDRLHVTVDEVRGRETHRRLDKKITWNDKVVGMYRQERLYRERQVKPGDRFDYPSYEPSINYVITTQVTVKDLEEVEVLGKKQRLLRVEATPDKVEAANGSIQLPTLIVWVDKDYVTVRSQVEVPGLGKFTLYRTTRELALVPTGPQAQLKDIGLTQLIKLNKKISRPYDAKNAKYRITIKGDKDPASAFAGDERQKIENVKDDSFELRVQAVRQPRPNEKPEKPNEEYSKSNYFINSDDAKVKAHATAAVGEENDPWKKSLRIEKWVHQNMRNKNFTEAFATADHVARTLEGDCTEHAMLAAAMCRAAGVPSRTVFGLIYIDGQSGPSMGFHMWTEVWVQGQWLPIDATLGRGYVGATHLKISDHSWHDTQSLTPLLPVVRVVGKIGIEVVGVDE